MRTDLSWRLDPGWTLLNHGSFGACPGDVLAVQQEWRDRMERQPVLFLDRDLPGLLDEARERVSAFLSADPAGLVFVPNATTGVNAVLRSLQFEAGDELLTDDHEYNATINAMRAVAVRDGATVVVAPVPFPSRGPDEVVAAILDRIEIPVVGWPVRAARTVADDPPSRAVVRLSAQRYNDPSDVERLVGSLARYPVF